MIGCACAYAWDGDRDGRKRLVRLVGAHGRGGGWKIVRLGVERICCLRHGAATIGRSVRPHGVDGWKELVLKVHGGTNV